MVKDEQVKRMLRLMKEKPELSFSCHAAQSGMSEPTARKYVRLGALPSTTRKAHTWRTREDLFAEVWPEMQTFLEANPGLEAKTLFDYLQRQYPGRFQDGQLRTLQRRLKRWRALEGPEREVYFLQQHKAGVLCQSDFTRMDSLGVTIGGEPFEHMVYHFVLAYCGWESCTVCFSESFESLSLGFQNALWSLGQHFEFVFNDKNQLESMNINVNCFREYCPESARQEIHRLYGMHADDLRRPQHQYDYYNYASYKIGAKIHLQCCDWAVYNKFSTAL